MRAWRVSGGSLGTGRGAGPSWSMALVFRRAPGRSRSAQASLNNIGSSSTQREMQRCGRLGVRDVRVRLTWSVAAALGCSIVMPALGYAAPLPPAQTGQGAAVIAAGANPVFSQDGQRIRYFAYDAPGPSGRDVFVVDRESSTTTNVTAGLPGDAVRPSIDGETGAQPTCVVFSAAGGVYRASLRP